MSKQICTKCGAERQWVLWRNCGNCGQAFPPPVKPPARPPPLPRRLPYISPDPALPAVVIALLVLAFAALAVVLYGMYVILVKFT